ncbi:YTH domain [Dillenia turbinata]|uniref:YTH domain n=1 Tax=Dillenia turbinata TaxID=194707 RepID=A0AAN8UGJ5_9MAGN
MNDYQIQGTEPNLFITVPVVDQSETMYPEGAPEFVYEQGLYYPAATNYGYYCTGLESPVEWDDHNMFFGLDGLEAQYTGAQAESLQYVYYTPSYGYAQSPYSPYNPYIPGATIGVDTPFVGVQQYYTVSANQNSGSSPAYVPVAIPSAPDVAPNVSIGPLLGSGASAVNRLNLSAATAAFNPRPTSHRTHSLRKVSEGARANTTQNKQSALHGSVALGLTNSAPHNFQALNNFSRGRGVSHRITPKVAPSASGLSDFGSTAHGRPVVDKLQPCNYSERVLGDISGIPLDEQSWGPRTNNSKNLMVVKAYTTKAGDGTAPGNIVICTDQFNKDDFCFDFAMAKFFVVKSYSEDDVHKSIKYTVWSSTPNGHKKLDSAYADAQKIAAGDDRGCPIFLFFSVNASGHFCGVAEMIGPVNFDNNMDFWQQDKWTGFFPVKWHFIKDVPNSNFRHIKLENNEDKPVTNSRDMQEIWYKQGMEMFKIFKNYTSKTSILDDFMFYENRQRLMHEQKARYLMRNYESQPAFDPPRKLNSVIGLLPRGDEKMNNLKDANILEPTDVKPDGNGDCLDESSTSLEWQASGQSDDNSRPTTNVKHMEAVRENGPVSDLKMGSPTLNTMQPKSEPVAAVVTNAFAAVAAPVVSNEPVDIVTVGSIHVKVNWFAELSGGLTVGTIPLDPRKVQAVPAAVFGKGGLQGDLGECSGSKRSSEEQRNAMKLPKVEVLDVNLPSRTLSSSHVGENGASTSSSGIRSNFIGMGFSPSLVDKAIKANARVKGGILSYFHYHNGHVNASQILPVGPCCLFQFKAAAQKSSSESSDSLDEFFNDIETVSNNCDLTADNIAKKALQESSSESLDSLDDLFSDNDDASKPLQFASGCHPKEEPEVFDGVKNSARASLLMINFSADQVDFAINKLEAPVNELVDYIIASQIAEKFQGDNTTHGDDEVSEVMGLEGQELCYTICILGSELPVAEIADLIFTDQIAGTTVKIEKDVLPASSVDYTQNRRMMGNGLKRHSFDMQCSLRYRSSKDPIQAPGELHKIPKPEHCKILYEMVAGPPYFFYESVANLSHESWTKVSRFLCAVDPEFVNTQFFSALIRKAGYAHNLPTEKRFHICPNSPLSIEEAILHPKKWWPSWDTRKQLSCIYPELLEYLNFVTGLEGGIGGEVSVESSLLKRNILKRWWQNTEQTGELVQIEDIQNGLTSHHFMNSFGFCSM